MSPSFYLKVAHGSMKFGAGEETHAKVRGPPATELTLPRKTSAGAVLRARSAARDDSIGFVAGIENEIGRKRHLPDAPPPVVESVPHREGRQLQSLRNQSLAQAHGRLRVIWSNELHDQLKIGICTIGDQDLEIHSGSNALTSSSGRTRPAFTSSRPAASADSN